MAVLLEQGDLPFVLKGQPSGLEATSPGPAEAPNQEPGRQHKGASAWGPPPPTGVNNASKNNSPVSAGVLRDYFVPAVTDTTRRA